MKLGLVVTFLGVCLVLCGQNALALSTGTGEVPGPANRLTGMLTFTSQPLAARLNIRVRPVKVPGLDANGDGTISDGEWQAAEMSLRKQMREGIVLRADQTPLPAVVSEMRLEEGTMTEVVIHYNLSKEPTMIELDMPVLRSLKGLPPAQISVMRDDVMIRPPELIWFNRPLTMNLERATTVTGIMLHPD